jgi:hypothetical protein
VARKHKAPTSKIIEPFVNMYSSTGISLKGLLSEYDMLEPEDDADLEMIAPNEYSGDYRGSKSSIEILPEISSPEWLQKEMILAKVSFVSR